jgi:hypothetical protein
MTTEKKIIWQNEEETIVIYKRSCSGPFSLLVCLVQKLEACWLLPLLLDLPSHISAAQTLPQLESVPVNGKKSQRLVFFKMNQ